MTADIALVVVDQKRRDSQVFHFLEDQLAHRDVKLIPVTSFNVIEKVIYYKPRIVFMGNVDTYHAYSALMIRPVVDFLLSIPTEQYLVTDQYNEDYTNIWRNSLEVGHRSGIKPVCNILDGIIVWGNQQKRAIREVLGNSIPVDVVGPIRLPAISKSTLPLSKKAVGVLIDEDKCFLKGLAYFDHEWFGGNKKTYLDISILAQVFQSATFRLITELAQEDVKFILRPRFNLSSADMNQIKLFLVAIGAHYEFDFSENLAYIAERSFVVISGNTSASIEIQALGIPVINVMSIFDNDFCSGADIKSKYGSYYPYKVSYIPESLAECKNYISLAKNGKLEVSPVMDKLRENLKDLFDIELESRKPKDHLSVGFFLDSVLNRQSNRIVDREEPVLDLIKRCKEFSILRPHYPARLIVRNLVDKPSKLNRLGFLAMYMISLSYSLVKSIGQNYSRKFFSTVVPWK
jgi:hypothetical protein